jgi:hypothetical protein
MTEREWKELNHRGIHRELPKELPMEFVQQFQEQIEKNHFQPLERLAQRGGLHPTELCAAMYNMDINKYFGKNKLSDAQTKFAINLLILKLNEFNKTKEG